MPAGATAHPGGRRLRPSRAPADTSPETAPGPAIAPSTWPLGASLLLFAGSGCSALIYEIVWFQLLELVVGSSAISLGILLGTFMGGIGLGSVLGPRLIPPRLHPFRAYAALELLIAAFGLLVLVEVPLAGSLYTGSGAHGTVAIVVRAAIAALCLLPPTVLMGATLPAIARWVTAGPGGVGWLGRLYAANIGGGILGCLLAGFHLLRHHDIVAATAVAAALNVTVALVALWIAARAPHARNRAPDSDPGPARGRGLAYWAIAISGLAALGAQVVWTRNLSLLLGPTVYTFAIILAVYLFGLGLGSVLGAARARSSDAPLRDLGVAQLLLVAALAWAAFAIGRSLPYWPVAPPLARQPWIVFQLDVVRCLWAILPATILWGASFPLALAAAARPGQDPGRLVAGVYVANTAGCIVGALGFSLVVIPGFGTRSAQQSLVALAAVIALALLAPWAWTGRGRGGRIVALGGAAAVAVILVIATPGIPSALIALGRYSAYRLGQNDATRGDAGDPHILYTGEGMTQSVVVAENRGIRLFHVSGKVEASTHPDDMRLQLLLGHIPALVHPAPRSVLIVGCGAGVTAGTFVTHPTIERIVICDIEPLVPRRVAPYFGEQNQDVIRDPRVEVVVDDARHFILTTRETFDVITSDPIHPWVSGSAALYSRDYFELVRRRLNPGGVVSQWVPIYQAGEAAVKSEIATFAQAFPHTTLWSNRNRAGGFDMVMLGTSQPARIDLDALDARLGRPDHARVAASLAGVGYPTAIDLLATYTGRREDLAPWLADARINRDRRLWLQYEAGLNSYVEQNRDIHGAIAAYRKFPRDLFVGSAEATRRLLDAGGTQRAAP